ncbi:interleukin-15 isoform X2 [Meriones unguiculatus]|uniref:interleukin-15 isoform X2 n=1 Tax=Meriones unguiculatus TaxID=10047 RepID=UPI00293F6F86|nr:interleukin-15 isoform X2 [Meriones unguiculatus]
MKILKPYMRNASISCCLCFLLNSHFLTEAGIHVFILGCLIIGLPKTEANWEYIRIDLEKIQNFSKSSCKFTALNCFLTELRVILHEYKYHDENLTDTVLNVMILGNSTLFSNKNIVEYGCKKCEELEEKNFTEFLQSFIRIVQMFSEKS